MNYPAVFSDLGTEIQSLSQEIVYKKWEIDLMILRGKDVRKFLHAMTTADINTLAPMQQTRNGMIPLVI